ncbi:MAG: hypothetical protein WB752_18505, partial [Pseudolabrys sp.]
MKVAASAVLTALIALPAEAGQRARRVSIEPEDIENQKAKGGFMHFRLALVQRTPVVNCGKRGPAFDASVVPPSAVKVIWVAWRTDG